MNCRFSGLSGKNLGMSTSKKENKLSRNLLRKYSKSKRFLISSKQKNQIFQSIISKNLLQNNRIILNSIKKFLRLLLK